MNRSYLVLTDSGCKQEEAPRLSKPVLVMRDTTERPEALAAGTVRLVGADSDVIAQEVRWLLDDYDHYEAMSGRITPMVIDRHVSGLSERCAGGESYSLFNF